MESRSQRILRMLNLDKSEPTRSLDVGTKNKTVEEFTAKKCTQYATISNNELSLPVLTKEHISHEVTHASICINESDDLNVESDLFERSDSEYIPSTEVSHTTDEDSYSIAKEKQIINRNILESACKENTLSKTKTKRKSEKPRKLKQCVQEEMPATTINVAPSTSFESPENNKESIGIYAATKDEGGKHIRNKGHACYFCQKIIQNSARHFEVVHGSEMEVAKIMAMPKKSKQRRDAFISLARVGDFYHNSSVITFQEGELILVRRPTVEESKFVTYSDYGPCIHCLGFMLKKHLWHHVNNSCNSSRHNDTTTSQKHIIAESNAMLCASYGQNLSSNFVTYIVSKIRDDEIGNYCRNDNLILRFGAMQFEKYGTTQCELIRQTMRQLSRFTLKLREIENSSKTLSDYLIPEKFDRIIEATKSLCVSHTNNFKRPEFEIPSLALKLGYAIKKCVSIKRGICLRAGNLSGNDTLMCFLNIMELEWSIRISSNALATMYTRKINVSQLLPLTSDLIKLSQYIDQHIKKVGESLSECPSINNWNSLAVLTLSKVIIFNKRRSGEASRITMVDYSSRPKWSDQCTEELKQSLTKFENELANQLTIVEVVGKRGKKVPILLTKNVKTAIDILIKHRNIVNIAKENPFVFARSGNNSLSNIRGHDCLRKTCSEAGLQHAENITSTKLRKYIATVCQVFNLTENEHDWLARHLGHDIRVHREFYRLHESAVELTKVSRLLLVVDKGDAHKFKGKRLDEINLEDMPTLDESENEEEQVEEIQDISLPSTSQNQDLSPMQPEPRREPPKKTKHCRKRPWSANEKGAVLRFFINSIKRSTVPGKADCLKCIAENAVLSARSWTDVKFCVKNQIDKINKIKLCS